MVDLDDAKYDRTVKAALLQRRRKRITSKRDGPPLRRRTRMGPRWWCWVGTTIVTIIVVVSVVLVHRQRQSNQRRLRRERLERAEALWQQRHAPEKRLASQQNKDPDPHLHHHRTPTRIHSNHSNSSNTDNYQDSLMEQFAQLRPQRDRPGMYPQIRSLLEAWLDYEDLSIRKNAPQPHPRWIRPHLLPPMFGTPDFRQGSTTADDGEPRPKKRLGRRGPRLLDHKEESEFFKVSRQSSSMVWQEEYQQLVHHYGSEEALPGPPVDYTDDTHYVYPDLLLHALENDDASSLYPPLQPLGQLLQTWPQDEDCSSFPIHEALQHFNYSDLTQRALAVQFRQAELPFKVYDIPELQTVTEKWSSDDYIGLMFGERYPTKRLDNSPPRVKYHGDHVPMASGTAQESPNNYFAFYVANVWDLHDMGLPPTRNNDWSYRQWSRHARYADAVNLTADRPHFYWQSGVPPEERYQDPSHWTFISRDLPTFSSRKPNFFVFSPDEQKGIQCRFGERGVVAATHFDGGRNMVAMIRGAKRYILSPPNQCSKLGIFTQKQSPIYRHSLLNFGHIQYLHQDGNNSGSLGMSPEERAWLERAATAQSVETVLKQGEVLYIPSHWFHYIISLQKSAQCNVRSGIDKEGNLRFGGRRQVEECVD